MRLLKRLIFIIFAWAIGAQANVAIYPTTLTLNAQKSVGTFTLKNNDNNADAKAISIDAQLRTWTQEDGKDVLSHHGDEILLMPPIFSISPNTSQAVRVAAMIDNAPIPVERCYRVTFKEFTPQIMKTITNSKINMSFLFLMNISVPVFIAPAHPKPLTATFANGSAHDGFLPILISNTSNIHIHLLGLKLMTGDNLLADSSATLYVLPGKTMAYNVKLPTAYLKVSNTFNIIAETDNQDTPELKGSLTISKIN